MKSKITILFISFLYCSFLANAQIKQGSILLGGQISFSHQSMLHPTSQGYDQKTNYGNISLSGGKAINDNSVIGLSLQFGSSNNYSFNGYTSQRQKSTRYGAGIFYRKYKTLAKDFYFFLEGGLNYSYGKSNVKDSSGNELQKTTQSDVGLRLGPGISYKVLKNLHLEISLPQMFSLDYGESKITEQLNSYKSNGITFNSNLNASALQSLVVGFRLIF